MATKKVAFFRVKRQGESDLKAWEDDVTLPGGLGTPEEYCKYIVELFNQSLRPGESTREFVEFLRVEEIEEKPEPVYDYDNDEDFFDDYDEDSEYDY